MKKKQILISLMPILLLIILFANSLSTEASINANNNTLADVLGQASKEYNTESNSSSYRKKDILLTDFIISSENVILKNNAHFEFVDAIGILDNNYINLSKDAIWKSQNVNVATVHNGRILGEGIGSTLITVTYGDFTKEINVTVLNDINISHTIDLLNENSPSLLSFTITDRNNIIQRAKDMTEVSWTPTKNLVGWRSDYTFSANTTYTGIPYSQTEDTYQVNKSSFIKALSATDFYNAYSRWNITMPKYGNDCSGFVSIAWGISRKTTGSFISGIQNGTYAKVGIYNSTNPTYTELKSSYASLGRGDAVVKDGHTFLIASNVPNSHYVYVYEQTPYKARYTLWYYDILATDGYMPFTAN